MSVLFERGIGMQRLSRHSTRRIMGRIGFFGALELLPALQLENNVYVSANVHAFLYDL